MQDVFFSDLGLTEYKRIWDYQKKLFEKVVAQKTEKISFVKKANYLLFCEHQHVYTLGKSGYQQNLLIDTIKLKNINASFFQIDRGGDITYHGPGQIVCYPIIDMEQFFVGVKEYIFKLEESVIQTLKEYKIEASRLKGAVGVWIDANGKLPRKICAIGVRTNRYVTMHGFAFNVNTDLNYFSYINPCGFTDKAITSLQKEYGIIINIEEVKNILKDRISAVFGMRLINTPATI